MDRGTRVIIETKTQETEGGEIVPERRLTQDELLACTEKLCAEKKRLEGYLARNPHPNGIEVDPEGGNCWKVEPGRLAAEDRLDAVNVALQRIKDRSYGICQWSGCGCPIDPERLSIYPATEYCTKHQAAAEIKRKGGGQNKSR